MKILTTKDIADYIISQTGKDIRQKNRKREHVILRLIYVSLCNKLLSCSLMKIGSEINKDHATIIHYNKLLDNPFRFTVADRRLMYKYKDRISKNFKLNKSQDTTEDELFNNIDKLRQEIDTLKSSLRIEKELTRLLNKQQSNLIEKNIKLNIDIKDLKLKYYKIK